MMLPLTGSVGSSPLAVNDVVFTFYLESWTDAQRRGMYMPGDRLVQTLLDDPTVRSLVVANPYRSAPVQWARRLAGRGPVAFGAGPGRTSLDPHRLGRRDPTTIEGLERLYAAYDRALERAAAGVGAEDPVVITTSPFVAGFAPLRWARQVTFYAWDDFASILPLRRWWPAYDEAYARVRDSGRAVAAVSQAIVDRIEPSGPQAVVPNGVVPDEWRSPPDPPSWFAGLPSPRIVYVGVLDDRLDVDAVRDIATRFSHGTVVLVGPVVDRDAVAALSGLPNVRVEPPVGRAEVTSLVHAADACIMPHRRTRLTAAMSPLKLYEYLAGGRPVVATDLPPVRVVDSRIVLVPEGASFADGVSRAVDRGPLAEPERLAFIDAHSWSRRHGQILALALGATHGV